MDYLEVKKCEVCGKTKHISEFSKSYPNRCKTCVAEHTRQMRAAEKLKAKVKATGEVIDVEPSGTLASPFHKHPDGSPMAGEEVFDRLWGEDVPAWSLWRLLELLPTEIRIGTSENVFGLHHETSDAWLLSYPYVKSFETASPIESCILAIGWLIDNGRFNKEYYNEEDNVQ